MSATITDCPICAPIMAAIAEAQDAHQLHYLHNVKIPHLKGITDEQRAELRLQVSLRFSALNHAANPNPKPRW